MNIQKKVSIILVFIILITILILTFSKNKKVDTHSAEESYSKIYNEYDVSQTQPLPLSIDLPPKKVALGERLFHEKRLSRDDTIACSSCHDLENGGVDRLPHSIGIKGAVGGVNAPTVFNSGFNFKQFWDGRADTLEDQVAGPIHNRIEMGSDWAEVLTKLKQDDSYQQAFKEIYPLGITKLNIADAIAVFEHSLITPNSRFDQFLRGDLSVITKNEKHGFKLFKDYGCISCHQGINLGGNMFQRFGVVRGYFDNQKLNKSDLGRFNVTSREEDRHVFKVPSLRNVAVTAPYLHDGSTSSLTSVVEIMGKYQLGRNISDDDVEKITAFLKTLTGQWKGKFLQ